MQGEKDFIGSLPKSLAVDHGSTSSDSTVVDQQICWTNFIQNPLAGANRVTRNLSLWGMGESSSSTVPDHVSQNRVESKAGHKWSSLVKAHPEPHQHEALPSRLLLSNANMNTTHTRVTVNQLNFNGMKPSMCASSSSGPVEMDGRQLPCKRKAHELNVDQSSSKIGSSNSFQWPEGSSSSSVWRSVSEIPTPTNTMHELNVDQSSSKIGSSNNFQRPEGSSNSVWRPVSEILTPTNTMHFDSTIPRLASGNREASVDNRGMENIRRNVRIRINSSRQQNQLPATNNNNGLLRNRSSSSRVNGPVNVIGRSRDNSRRIPTNALDHPLFIQPHDIRNPAQSAINLHSDLVGGNMTRNRNASTSNLMPNLGPNHGSSSNSFRSHSEYLRRALSSSIGLGAGGGSGGQSSNLFSGLPPVGASASSSQESGIPPVIAVAGQNPHYYPPHSRTSDRQLDGAFAFPYPARIVAGGSERRGRLTEIRNVLDRLRRGEGLRLEDAMILNQSVFYGMAGIHDRHRDMRLDIDNMSYEELLALEERIGNVNTGLTEENVYKHLKQKNYTSVAGQPDDEPCCICQEEYKDGDDLGALECGHEFHTSCIKQWLLKKNLCPVCKSAASK